MNFVWIKIQTKHIKSNRPKIIHFCSQFEILFCSSKILVHILRKRLFLNLIFFILNNRCFKRNEILMVFQRYNGKHAPFARICNFALALGQWFGLLGHTYWEIFDRFFGKIEKTWIVIIKRLSFLLELNAY